jgi:hypothetical protein
MLNTKFALIIQVHAPSSPIALIFINHHHQIIGQRPALVSLDGGHAGQRRTGHPGRQLRPSLLRGRPLGRDRHLRTSRLLATATATLIARHTTIDVGPPTVAALTVSDLRQVPESQWASIPDVIGRIDDEALARMREKLATVYEAHFASMARMVDTVLNITRDRIYAHGFAGR